MKNTQTTSSAALYNPHGHNHRRKEPTKVQEEGKLFENNLIKSHSIGPGKESCFMMAGCVWSSQYFAPFRLHSRKAKFQEDVVLIDFEWWSNERSLLLCIRKMPRMDTSWVWRALVILENFSSILILEKFWKNFSSFWNNCCAPDTAWPWNPFSFVASVVPKLSL